MFIEGQFIEMGQQICECGGRISWSKQIRDKSRSTNHLQNVLITFKKLNYAINFYLFTFNDGQY